MTTIYFVRHAQPEYGHFNNETRPLTAEGKEDTKMVLEFFKDKKIDIFYCSPYKRSIDTIAETAKFFKKEIILDVRLRERKSGPKGNTHEMFRKRWENHMYCEPGGESIAMVQERNMAVLKEILEANQGKNVVVGTHSTALSTILNYYDNTFGCDDFLRIIDWMPYIVSLEFDKDILIAKKEHGYVEKEFIGKIFI